MAARCPPTNAHESTPGHRQPGETRAPEAEGSASQGTNAVRGTWGSEGDAGRPLRTTAGQTGANPTGQATPSGMPLPLRLERIATQARAYPERACPTLAHPVDGALRERAFPRLTPHSAPGVDRVTWRADKEHLEANLTA
jgi:hypothetical protein